MHDIGWLPDQFQNQLRSVLGQLPRVGTVTEQDRPLSIPSDGTVYDPAGDVPTGTFETKAPSEAELERREKWAKEGV